MNKLFWQLFRFGIVGASAAVIHIGIVIMLVQSHMLVPLAANIVAFSMSFQMSYWGHRLWTFHESDALHRTAIPKLLLVQIINLAANESLFFIFLSMQIPYIGALILVQTILPIFTFLSSKFWVFQ